MRSLDRRTLCRRPRVSGKLCEQDLGGACSLSSSPPGNRTIIALGEQPGVHSIAKTTRFRLRARSTRLASHAAWARYIDHFDVFICPTNFAAAFPDDTRPFQERTIATPEGDRPSTRGGSPQASPARG